MKILIKTHEGTFKVIKNGMFENHISSYHNFNHNSNWQKQGHQVAFIKEDSNWRDEIDQYDVLFFRGYNSFRYQPEFAVELLKAFKGRKILYLEGTDENDIGQYFDTIFVPEIEMHYKQWVVKYLGQNKDIRMIPWTSPEFDLLDYGENPYHTSEFKVIYTGIFNERMLNIFKAVAEEGYLTYIGGSYYDGKILRELTDYEFVDFPRKLNLISRQHRFIFGQHFPFLRYADVALNLYAYDFEGALSSKLTEYLCCGLPVICEKTCPNRFRVSDFRAGAVVEWNNIKAILYAIEMIKESGISKEYIKQIAREHHDPYLICQKILA